MRKRDVFSLLALEQLFFIVLYVICIVKFPSRLSLTDGIKMILTINTVVLLLRIVFIFSEKCQEKYGKLVVHSVKILTALVIAGTSLLLLLRSVNEPISVRTFVIFVLLLVSYVYFSDVFIKIHIKCDKELDESTEYEEKGITENKEAHIPED